jgi:tripartite-type tricarboxylate transporter receptor subunit TctC
VKELVAYEKANPGKLHYASGGNGSAQHVPMEMFKQIAGIADVVSGQIEMLVTGIATASARIKAGQVRAIVNTGAARSPLIPDVPTMVELGYKDIHAVAWFGLLVPLGTPQPIIRRLNREVNAVLASDEVRSKLITAGYVPEGGPPEALAAQMRSDDARYRRLVRELGIKVH